MIDKARLAQANQVLHHIIGQDQAEFYEKDDRLHYRNHRIDVRVIMAKNRGYTVDDHTFQTGSGVASAIGQLALYIQRRPRYGIWWWINREREGLFRSGEYNRGYHSGEAFKHLINSDINNYAEVCCIICGAPDARDWWSHSEYSEHINGLRVTKRTREGPECSFDQHARDPFKGIINREIGKNDYGPF